MHARVTMFSSRPGVLTQLINAVRAEVLPDVQRYKGLVRTELLTRSRINRVILTTYWTTEYDAMQAEVDGQLDRSMTILEPFVAGPAIVEGYEISIVRAPDSRAGARASTHEAETSAQFPIHE